MQRPEDRLEEILAYWFGGTGGDPLLYDRARERLWFREGRRFDAEIRERFGGTLAELAAAAPPSGAAGARGALARVIVLDQFSRHVFRDTPRAFAQDEAARAVALDALNRDLDRGLHPVERAFLYLPLEHAEDRALQQRCVRLHETLLDSLPPACRGHYLGFLEHARRHRDIIERFGRFPHRNRVLGRRSTAAERAFLREAGSYA